MNYRDEFGTIEAGKVADLVIQDGDPLNDHRLVGSRVAAFFRDGKSIINNCTLKVAAADMI
jgi:imidazolonepropionase-like amidohydrolase